MFVSIFCSLSSLLTSESFSGRLLMSRLISASILGPVFGYQDKFLGLAIFLDTFRNDLHGMDVSLLCVSGGHWQACFFAGPVFSNNAHFHGLAVLIDTYSNDEATDVSGGSGFSFSAWRFHVQFEFFIVKPHVISISSMLTFKKPVDLIQIYFHVCFQNTMFNSSHGSFKFYLKPLYEAAPLVTTRGHLAIFKEPLRIFSVLSGDGPVCPTKGPRWSWHDFSCAVA